MVVRDGRICGDNGVVVGRVMSERQWGFVLVVREVHDVECEVEGMYMGVNVVTAVWAPLLCAFGRSFFVGVSAIEVGD